MKINTKEVTFQPDAVEKIFCEPFHAMPTKQFTSEQAELYIRVCMQELTGETETPEELVARVEMAEGKDKIPPLVKMMLARLKAYEFEMTGSLFAFMLTLVDRPGTVVMYYIMFQWWCSKNNIKVIGPGQFGRLFPMGVPTEESFSKAWEHQKVVRGPLGGSDNLLDYNTAMESIRLDVPSESN